MSILLTMIVLAGGGMSVALVSDLLQKRRMSAIFAEVNAGVCPRVWCACLALQAKVAAPPVVRQNDRVRERSKNEIILSKGNINTLPCSIAG